MELERPEQYFPYIQHTLDAGKDPLRLKENMIDRLFSRHQPGDRGLVYDGHSMVYSRAVVRVPDLQHQIAADPDAVTVLVPRHRSLFDYAIHQPVHHDLVQPKIMIVVGHNLLVHRFDRSLRNFGGFMFLRDDAVLSRPGLPKVTLTKDRYLKEVFPAYLRDQMVERRGDRHDLLVYLEYERDPKTGKSNAGRTKTGRLRRLNWSFLRVLHDVVEGSGVKLFLTPVNISFSKVPDVPFVVHPKRLKGVLKPLSYVHEQRFVFRHFPRYAERRPAAKIETTVTYGQPDEIGSLDFSSFRDIRAYATDLRRRIGLLETVYPGPLIFAAMDADAELPEATLAKRMQELFDRFRALDVDCGPVSDRGGNMLPFDEIFDAAAATMNNNPNFIILGPRTRRYLRKAGGRVLSADMSVQTWYRNSLAHLFEPDESRHLP